MYTAIIFNHSGDSPFYICIT